MPHLPHPGPEELLDLVAALGPWTLLAVLNGPGTGSTDGVELAAHRLVPDHRSGAAALFGICAPAGSTAVAVSLLGTLRRLDERGSRAVGGRPGDATPVAVDLVVVRTGTHQSRVRTDGGDAVCDGPGDGLLLDALHRVLGLPAPGRPPGCAGVGLGIWSHRLVHAVARGGPTTWSDAVALHPAWSGRERTPPSPEALAEAGRRFDDTQTWAALRRRAAAGVLSAADLTPGEADWLDDTAFGRWCTQSFPSPGWTERELRANAPEVARRYAEVVRRSG